MPTNLIQLCPLQFQILNSKMCSRVKEVFLCLQWKTSRGLAKLMVPRSMCSRWLMISFRKDLSTAPRSTIRTCQTNTWWGRLGIHSILELTTKTQKWINDTHNIRCMWVPTKTMLLRTELTRWLARLRQESQRSWRSWTTRYNLILSLGYRPKNWISRLKLKRTGIETCNQQAASRIMDNRRWWQVANFLERACRQSGSAQQSKT